MSGKDFGELLWSMLVQKTRCKKISGFAVVVAIVICMLAPSLPTLNQHLKKRIIHSNNHV